MSKIEKIQYDSDIRAGVDDLTRKVNELVDAHNGLESTNDHKRDEKCTCKNIFPYFIHFRECPTVQKGCACGRPESDGTHTKDMCTSTTKTSGYTEKNVPYVWKEYDEALANIEFERNDIVHISDKYQDLSDEKKRKVLENLDSWTRVELSKVGKEATVKCTHRSISIKTDDSYICDKCYGFRDEKQEPILSEEQETSLRNDWLSGEKMMLLVGMIGIKSTKAIADWWIQKIRELKK